MSAHTPGPWVLIESQRNQGYGGYDRVEPFRSLELLVCGAGGEAVVTRRGLAKPTKATGKANARLIAAAPDLLEALLAAEDKAQRGLFNMTDDEIQRVHDLRRAAIAKATITPQTEEGS